MSDDQEQKKIAMASFLESAPPGSRAQIEDFHVTTGGSVGGYKTNLPDLVLHCDSTVCSGDRVFRSVVNPGLISEETRFFAVYRCRNCNETSKVYALIGRITSGDEGLVYKLGEYPPFGPPVPSRVITLIGPDRDLFLRGRRCENQAFGIAAFAYYRRVIEHQWKRLIDEIVKVSEKVGAPQELTSALGQAAKETQFSKAVDTAKAAIPQTLLISGHNPLTLLHSALSEGLHEKSDEDCLVLAQSIRVVLTELAEKMSLALKDHAEIQTALSRLLNRK
jgi:hypothetical protein